LVSGLSLCLYRSLQYEMCLVDHNDDGVEGRIKAVGLSLSNSYRPLAIADMIFALFKGFGTRLEALEYPSLPLAANSRARPKK
jgi:hypothetical protein